MSEGTRAVVWISHKVARCDACTIELTRGEFIAMDRAHGIRCIKCARLDGLVFLPAGDVALTRRALALSARSVLVAGELHVNYKGQEKVVLKPGMYAYGPSTLPHSASCAGSASCVLFIAFESAVDAVPTQGAAK